MTALYISAAAPIVAAASLGLSAVAVLAWRRETARNDTHDKFMEGYAQWMVNMQETTDNNNKQMRRIVSHLVSERRTRHDFSAQTYLMLDGMAQRIGVPEPERVKWRNSTLPILREMERDAEDEG